MRSKYLQPLHSGCMYHVYNRGNNKEKIFLEPTNYQYFLSKVQEYIAPIASVYAYCLMPNHFHLLIRFKGYPAMVRAFPEKFPTGYQVERAIDAYTAEHTAFEKKVSTLLSRQFANLFSTYTMAFNRRYERSGKLFSLPFRRIRVWEPAYARQLILYLHRNPIHHGWVQHYPDWPYSSFLPLLKPIIHDHWLAAVVPTFFDDPSDFIQAHRDYQSIGSDLPARFLLEATA